MVGVFRVSTTRLALCAALLALSGCAAVNAARTRVVDPVVHAVRPPKPLPPPDGPRWAVTPAPLPQGPAPTPTGNPVQHGLISQRVNHLGQTVTRTVDRTGAIVERTLEPDGRLVTSENIGPALDTALSGLVEIGRSTNSAGQTVRRLRSASGAVVEIAVDQAGQVVLARVVQSAGSWRR